MKHIQLLKFATYLIGFTGLLINVLDSVVVYFFNRPLWTHFYLVKKKLSKKQKKFLQNNVRFYQQLDEKHQRYFEHRLALFVREYDFIARDGFEITPEVKVLIAASYIKLTFGMRKFLTTVFNKIVVYPKPFFSRITQEYHKGEFNPGFKMVVFSWEDFLLGDIIMNDNLNLGIHEFTHALTFHGKKSTDASAAIFYDAFEEIIRFSKMPRQQNRMMHSGYFRDYAHTNQLEFIAVIMEHFFETPKELQQQFPELFAKILQMLNYKSILDEQLFR